MYLTRYSDYALRTLIYLGLHRDRVCTVREIADAYSISQSHLTKIVNQLGILGLVATARGRAGGVRLGRAPEDISVGSVIRETEQGLDLVECFDLSTNTCPIAGCCSLARLLQQALDAFFEVLDGKTLADLLVSRRALLVRLAPASDALVVRRPSGP